MASLVRVAILLSVLVLGAGSAFAAPVEYKLDDDSDEGNLGFNGDGDFWWANAFTATAVDEITGISILFNTQDRNARPSLVAVNDSFTVTLHNDPNNDGNPIDAVLLAQASGTVQILDSFFTVSIPKTVVNGTFFVGAIYNQFGAIDPPPNQFPAARDMDISPGLSWISGFLGTIDPADLGGTTSTGVLRMNDFGFSGVFMLRAVAVPEPGTLALFGLGGILMAAGFCRRRRARA